MTLWVRALLDSRTMARRVRIAATEAGAPHLLALLILGDVEGFVRIAPRYGFKPPSWYPLLQTGDTTEGVTGISSDRDDQFLKGALSFVVGRSDAPDLLISNLDDGGETNGEDRDFAAVASIIRSLSMTDNGRVGEAIAVLQSAESVDPTPYALAALKLQRASVIDQFEPPESGLHDIAASLWAEVAQQELPFDAPPPGGHALDKVIHAIAERGHYRADRRRGILIWGDTDEHYAAHRMLETEENGAFRELADSLLMETFESNTRGAVQTVTVIGRSSDRTNDVVGRALLRARCLADPSETRYLRRLLARNQVVHTFGSDDADSAAAALATLVDTGDSTGVERSAWLLWSAGPHSSLKRVAEREIASLPENPRDRLALDGARVNLLRNAADVLNNYSAKRLAYFCLRALESPHVGAADRIELLQICKALAEGADDETHIDFLLHVRNPGSTLDDTFYSNLASQIRWAAIPVDVRRETLDWLRSGDVTREGTIRSLLEGLAPYYRRQVVSAAKRRVKKSNSVADATTLWNVGFESGALTAFDLDLIENSSVGSLRRIQEAARGRTYSIGAGAQPVSLLARVAMFANISSAWSAVVDFLVDPAVSSADKEMAVRLLSARSDLVPPHVKRDLRRRLEGVAGPQFFTTDQQSVFTRHGGIAGLGITTREQLLVAVAVGSLPASDSLAVIADLLSSSLSEDRIFASSAIYAMSRTRSRQHLVPYALALARDSDSDVRADGLRTLANLRPVTKGQSRAVVRTLDEALRDPGVLIPLRVIGGLLDAPPSSGEGVLVNSVGRLTDHASTKIRLAVEVLATRMREG